MYTNMFGCDHFGYAARSDICTDPHAGEGVPYWRAAVFFPVFVVVCSFVLLSLFLGAVTTAIDHVERLAGSIERSIECSVQPRRRSSTRSR